MLHFFRKYQRFFFLIITVVVIFSFTFFGTYSAFVNSSEKKSDKVIGSYIDGSKMLESDVKMLSYFISSDAEGNLSSSHGMPNLLNDSVIRKDILETGIGALLAKEYFEVINAKLGPSFERMKRFVPYQHPNAPQISARAIWDRFAPGISQNLDILKEQAAFSPDAFDLLSAIYLSQAYFPAQSLRRILAYQQKQVQGLPFDNRLYHDDLALFGYHTLAEWFSQDFLDLASEFILNTAVLAKEKGYQVSSEVAKEHMLRTLKANAERVFPKDALANLNLGELYQKQLMALGLDEKSAVKIWQKILLSRMYFESASAVFLDPLPFNEFASYAGEKALIERCDLPSSLQLKSLQDLFKLQLYIKAVSAQKGDILDLPKTFQAASEVQKQYPSLVKRRYFLEIAEASLAEAGLKVKVKEMWDWQLEDSNWKVLQKEFPVLAQVNKNRFETLKALDEATRAKVDAFSVQKMVKAHPEWIQETLAKKAGRTQELALFPYTDRQILPGITNSKKLIGLLESAANGDSSAEEQLNFYSDDGKSFYRFSVKDKSAGDEVLRFEEALSLEILDSLLDDYLTKEYPKVRTKSAKKFQTADGAWTPLDDVKDDVGMIVFQDLIKAIDTEGRASGGVKGKDLAEFYLQHRFFPVLRKAKDALAIDPNYTEWFASEEKKEAGSFTATAADLSSQWKLKKKLVTLTRQDADFSKLGIDSLHEGDISDVKGLARSACFFSLKEKRFEEPEQSKDAAHALLTNEAKRALTQKLLKEIKLKDAIVLPLLQEEKEKEEDAI